MFHKQANKLMFDYFFSKNLLDLIFIFIIIIIIIIISIIIILYLKKVNCDINHNISI